MSPTRKINTTFPKDYAAVERTTPLLILYSGTGHRGVVETAFSGEDVVSVETPEELRAALEGVESAVVVVEPETANVVAIEGAARAAGAHLVTVLLAGGPAEKDVHFDAVAPRDPDVDALRSAVDRARRVAAYRESVGTLYDRSREYTGGQLGSDVLKARKTADDRFADLPPLDSGTIDALLREEGDEF